MFLKNDHILLKEQGKRCFICLDYIPPNFKLILCLSFLSNNMFYESKINIKSCCKCSMVPEELLPLLRNDYILLKNKNKRCSICSNYILVKFKFYLCLSFLDKNGYIRQKSTPNCVPNILWHQNSFNYHWGIFVSSFLKNKNKNCSIYPD